MKKVYKTVAELLATEIRDKNFDFKLRTRNSIIVAKISALQDLLLYTGKDLMDMEMPPAKFGKKSIKDINEVLKNLSIKYFHNENSLHLGMSKDELNKLILENKIHNPNIITKIESRLTTDASSELKALHYVEIRHINNKQIAKVVAPTKSAAEEIQQSLDSYFAGTSENTNNVPNCKVLVTSWKAHEIRKNSPVSEY